MSQHIRSGPQQPAIMTTMPTDMAKEWTQAAALIDVKKICDIDKLLQAIRFLSMDRLDESGFKYRIDVYNENSVYVCVQPGCDPTRMYKNDKSFLYHIHTHHLKSIALYQCPECGQKIPHITKHMAEHEARNLHLAEKPLTIKNTFIRSIPGMSDSQVMDLSKSFNNHSLSD